MKPQLLKVPTALVSSFTVREEVVPFFYNRLHYHPEIELVYIEKGDGTQFVGDNICQFNEGDVVLIGSSLPHYWRCSEEYFKDLTAQNAKSIAVHFTQNFWGRDFLELPEHKQIKDLLRRAKKGIKLSQSIKQEVAAAMKQMVNSCSAKRVILLLDILDKIAEAHDNIVLSSDGFMPSFDDKENERINNIYTYTLTRFKEKITLDSVAAVANVSPNSFCRYFKLKTKKNFSRFLHEVRIGHACKLLMENKLTIAHICYESGFNNFANFYRAFKLVTQKLLTSISKNTLLWSISKNELGIY